MKAALKLGPADHGRPLTYEEFMAGDYVGGYQYELIDGRLYVAPAANLSEDSVRTWLYVSLHAYAAGRPEVINYVTTGAPVFVPERAAGTAPEPDVAPFHDFPPHGPLR